jgi:hypothetical protein
MGDTIAFCPPMIITEAELNELFDRFEKALAATGQAPMRSPASRQAFETAGHPRRNPSRK